MGPGWRAGEVMVPAGVGWQARGQGRKKKEKGGRERGKEKKKREKRKGRKEKEKEGKERKGKRKGKENRKRKGKEIGKRFRKLGKLLGKLGRRVLRGFSDFRASA
jgi:hypothetical protein